MNKHIFIPFFTFWKILNFDQVNIFTFLWRLHQMFWHGVYITLISITSLSCLMSFDHPFCCVTIHSLNSVIKQGKAKWMGGVAKLNRLNNLGGLDQNLQYIAPPTPKSNCPQLTTKNSALHWRKGDLEGTTTRRGRKTQWATNNALWPPPVKGTQSDHCISRGLDLS